MAHRPHIKVNRTFFYSSKAPATAAGGLFAVLQSVGVLGVATSTKVAISAVAGAAGTLVASVISLWT